MVSRSDITVIPLEHDLDVTSAPLLRLALEQLLMAGCCRAIVNMARAQYVDTAGMGVLVAASRRFREAGGLLSITEASPQVIHALRVGCLVDFIPVRSSANASLPELDASVRPRWQRTLRVEGNDIGRVRRRFEEQLRGVPLTQDEVFDLTLACGEAVGNAVDHTSEEGVLVTVSAYADRLVVQVTDNGEGFETSDAVQVGSEDRGRGIALMRMLADSVDIRCKAHGQGTVVTIVKLLDAEAL